MAPWAVRDEFAVCRMLFTSPKPLWKFAGDSILAEYPAKSAAAVVLPIRHRARGGLSAVVANP